MRGHKPVPTMLWAESRHREVNRREGKGKERRRKGSWGKEIGSYLFQKVTGLSRKRIRKCQPAASSCPPPSTELGPDTKQGIGYSCCHRASPSRGGDKDSNKGAGAEDIADLPVEARHHRSDHGKEPIKKVPSPNGSPRS